MAVLRPSGETKIHQQHQRENAQHLVFTLHKDHGTEVYLVANVLDCAIAVIVARHNVIDEEGDPQASEAQQGW